MSTTVSPTGTISVPVDPVEAQNQTSPPPQAEKAKAELRPYVVLQKAPSASPSSKQAWEFVRNVDASSAEQAVRKTAELILATSEDSGSITLVAITASRFVPVTVAFEVKTQLKLS
jgi:hypothetical protein